ncbi:unnamed protein product [Moneuplotes crassus]|uniref:Uncharacterized protein n=1 Tax=Euplotes crassus TaxID=5936 RepID=A0AAD1XTU4_EUPCR|nr:unnamed protein product [Moneuplotes crassus]
MVLLRLTSLSMNASRDQWMLIMNDPMKKRANMNVSKRRDMFRMLPSPDIPNKRQSLV